jgi:hypothetical protein
LAAITAPSGHEQGNQAFQYQKPTVMEGKQVAAPLLEKQTGRITRSAPSLDRVQQPEGTTI